MTTSTTCSGRWPTRCEQHLLDAGAAIRIVDRPAIGVDHIEGINDLGAKGAQPSRPNIKRKVRESPGQPVEQAD
jgi:hypothetical protein